MLCNNADARRCSYFELGLPVAIAGKFTYFAEQKKISYPASFQNNFKVNEKFIFYSFSLVKRDLIASLVL